MIIATVMMPASVGILAAVFGGCEILWKIITATIAVAIRIVVILEVVVVVVSSSSRGKSRTGASFIVAPSMTALLHRKPGSSGTADSCNTQDSSKSNAS